MASSPDNCTNEASACRGFSTAPALCRRGLKTALYKRLARPPCTPHRRHYSPVGPGFPSTLPDGVDLPGCSTDRGPFYAAFTGPPTCRVDIRGATSRAHDRPGPVPPPRDRHGQHRSADETEAGAESLRLSVLPAPLASGDEPACQDDSVTPAPARRAGSGGRVPNRSSSVLRSVILRGESCCRALQSRRAAPWPTVSASG
jgi:hypothetical protein